MVCIIGTIESTAVTGRGASGMEIRTVVNIDGVALKNFVGFILGELAFGKWGTDLAWCSRSTVPLLINQSKL